MYANSVRRETARLPDSGLTLSEVHRQSGVSRSALRDWRRDPEGRANPRTEYPRCGRRELDRGAYAYLLGLYLGDGHIVHHRRGVIRLTIACRDGRPGLIEEAAGAIAVVMPMSSVGASSVPAAPS